MVAQGRYQRADSWRPSKNAAIGDGHVWKAYDYRGRNVGSSDRRWPDLSCKFIPGCMTLCESTDLVVIRYPYLEGSHQPRSVGQWIALLRCVQLLHRERIVHGDLRLSNLVFSITSDVVTIIDYDFAGHHEDKKYPPRFNCNIDDGARHRSATAGRALLYEHDWFAVAAMMKLCQPEQEEPRWRQAQTQLQEPSVTSEVVDEVIQLLEKCSTLSLVLQDDKASSLLAVEGGPALESQRRSDLVVLLAPHVGLSILGRLGLLVTATACGESSGSPIW
jgi:serine/threonine protein kinase